MEESRQHDDEQPFHGDDDDEARGNNDTEGRLGRSPQHASLPRGGNGGPPSYHVRYPSASSVSSSASLNVPPPPSSTSASSSWGWAAERHHEDRRHGNDHNHNHSFSNMETPLVGHTQKKKAYGTSHSHSHGGGGIGVSNHRPHPSSYRSTPLDRCVSGDENGDDDNDDRSKGEKNRRSFDESDEDRALLLGEGGDGSRDDENDDETDDDRSVNTSYSSATASSIVTVTTAATNFRDNLMLPFTDEAGSKSSIVRGLTALLLVGTVLGVALKPRTAPTSSINPEEGSNSGSVTIISNSIPWHPWYPYLSSVIGYSYVVLWSVCFYPQVLLNHRRRSTKGLSPDFAVLNFLGWSYYSLYLSEMYWDGHIKALYQARFKDEASTVASNDVAFAIHATLLSATYLIQIAYYADSGSMTYVLLHLKPQTWCLVLLMVVPTAVVPVLIFGGFLDRSAWLDYFYVLSFFKILCTLTKYAKQALLNYHRKSTKGWNIWYNFLECTGGTLSMLQIVLDSASRGNWSGITGNLAKFALGLATVVFDGVFFAQHYVWYPDESDSQPKNAGRDEEEGSDPTQLITVPRPSDRFEIVYLTSPDDIGAEPGGSGGLDDLDNDEENVYG